MAQVSIAEEYGVFYDWLMPFVRKNGGVVPTERWFIAVQQKHKKLRQFLGGVRKDIHIDAENCSAAVNANVKKRGLEILTKLAVIGNSCIGPLKEFGVLSRVVQNRMGYARDGENDNHATVVFGLLRDGVRPSQEQITKVMERYLQPTIQLAPHRFISTTKLLSQFVDGRSKEQSTLISELGKLYGEVKARRDPLLARISTSAKAFMLLGHCGPDKDSCFGQSGGRQLDKIALGISEETFVIVLYKDDKPVTRAWGQVQYHADKTPIVHVCNVYSRNIPCGVAEAALKEVAVFLTGDKQAAVIVGALGDARGDCRIYLNDDMRISAGQKDDIHNEELVLDIESVLIKISDGLHKGFMCSECKTMYDSLDDFGDRGPDGCGLTCRDCYDSGHNGDDNDGDLEDE
jgi:hypothetical protein